MADTRRLSELAESAMGRLALPDGSLVVALSGGADSAALTLLCVRAGRRPRAVHVNHGLAHSERLEAAARSIAGGLEVDLEVVHVSVPEGPSPEGQARRARYAALVDALQEGEALMTAHTLDDDAETVLLNLIRGTGARGLAGIPRWRPPRISRPVLDVRRSEMREIATLAGLGYIDDPMNEDLGLTRNWIRKTIIPELEAANPRLRESLHRATGLVQAESALIEEMARSNAPQLKEGGARVALGQLLTIPAPVASRVLVGMIEHVLGTAGVSADRISRMWSVARGESTRQEIGDGAIVEMVGPMLVLLASTGTGGPSEQILGPGVHRVGGLELEVLVAPGPSRVIPLSAWVAVFPPDTELIARDDRVVTANGEEAWIVGEKRLPVARYEPGTVGYLLVTAREGTGWTSRR